MGPQALYDPFAAAHPSVRELYERLLAEVRSLGPFEEEWKKTSIHLLRKSAFAGVHPRKSSLILTIKAAGPIASKRIRKAEQVSKNRWHLDVAVASASDIDAELVSWLRDAYALCA